MTTPDMEPTNVDFSGMKPPEKLYRYRSFTTNDLLSLKNREIWFSRPKDFNDPYDCNTSFTLKELPPTEYTAALRILVATMKKEFGNDSEKFRREKSKFTDSAGMPNEFFINLVRHDIEGRTKQLLSEMQKNGGVCCFSSTWKDPLLWSHYAKGHRGFCLEFDTQFFPFSRARKVGYSKNFPEINPCRIWELKPTMDDFMATISTKHLSWDYEEEWRVFYVQGGTAFPYGIDALTAVLFGSEMPEKECDIVAHLLHGSPTRLFRVKRSTKDFSMTREELAEYVPYDVGKTQSARSTHDDPDTSSY